MGANPTSAVAALLLSILLLQTGGGLFNSLIGVRLGQEVAISSEIAGLVMAFYFLGIFAGSMFGGRVIERVGHVRAFAAFASIMSAVAVAHAFWLDPIFWAALRFFSGVCIAGSLMVAETWLNGSVSNAHRGRLLSIYMICQNLGFVFGPFMLNLSDPAVFILYGVVSILFSLALVPLLLAKSASSAPISASKLTLKELYKISPLGMVGSFGSGVLNGGLFGAGAIFAASIGMGVETIAIYISSFTLGGIIVQYPIGKLSDIFDRRTVLVMITAFSAASSLVLAWMELSFGVWPFIVLGAFNGGLAVTLYSIAVAHTNDFVDPQDVVPASASMLMTFGVGAVCGPIVMTWAIGVVGDFGFYGSSALMAALVTLFGLWRMTRRAAPDAEEQAPFVAVPTVGTPVAFELDPRSDVEEEQDAKGEEAKPEAAPS